MRVYVLSQLVERWSGTIKEYVMSFKYSLGLPTTRRASFFIPLRLSFIKLFISLLYEFIIFCASKDTHKHLFYYINQKQTLLFHNSSNKIFVIASDVSGWNFFKVSFIPLINF